MATQHLSAPVTRRAAGTATRPPLRRDDPTRGKRGRSLLLSVFLVVVALTTLIPFWALFVGTFQDGTLLFRQGLNLGIDFSRAGLDNYVLLFTNSGDYFRWFANSLMLTAVQVTLVLLISSFVAYGFAMYEFRFKLPLFVAVVMLMTVPFEMLMLPLFVQVHGMGLGNSYAGVILPFVASAVTIFFFRQYLMGFPKEIVEAGRVDGVTEFGIFFRLVLPVMKPAIAAMAILNGMFSWNSFLWPLLVLQSSEMFTLPIGLNTLLTPYDNRFSLLIVGAFFSLFPILILFLVFQRFFIQGMTAGAVKG